MISPQLCAAAIDALEGNFMAPSCRHESDTVLYYQAAGIKLLGRAGGKGDIKPRSVCMCGSPRKREHMWSSGGNTRRRGLGWWGVHSQE